MSKTTLLIDSDIVAFKFASTNQKDYDWGDGVTSREVADLEDVKPEVDAYLADLKERLKADELLICLSVPSSEGFRKSILPSYKENREGVERPELLQAVKDYLAEAYPSYIRPTLEADDVMGILSTHPTLIPGRKIIVSEDKDMQTIPGWLFNPRKDTKPRLISTEEADYFHMYQTLIGDTTDGYKGCPDAGPSAAEEYLRPLIKKVPYEHVFSRGPRKGTSETRYTKEPAGSWWEVMVSLYEAKGLTEEDALVQARVARICRASDYDFKRKEVILWNPCKTAP